MATTITEKIKVNKLTKYGFQVGDEFVNYSKLFKDQAKVVPGIEFDAELYVADSGKRYLNKILGQLPSSAKEVPPTAVATAPGVDSDRAKKFVPKFEKKASADTSMSKEEWAAKDQRISRQGVIQAAVIALAPVVSLDTLSVEAKKLANEMLSFVNGK